jgi:uncharacterized RDD family membrane protein YckC
MRCPKCRYISFGTTDRCRNCGYDFSLAEDTPAPPDLPMHAEPASVGPLGDLPLAPVDAPESRPAREPAAQPEPPKPPPRTMPSSRPDLPLFSRTAASDDAPLIGPPVAPRPPLAVRKPGPAIVRVRSGPAAEGDSERESGTGDVGADALQSEFASEVATVEKAPSREAPAGLIRRAIAGVIDLALLAAIDGTVVYLTMRVLELPPADFRLLPPVPLVAFLLLLDGGYLAIFTAAGGQTIGKMSTGIRVVPAAGGVRVPFGTAVLRAAAFVASVLPLGLGLVPILLTPDRRALHDRLADTRVVQA